MFVYDLEEIHHIFLQIKSISSSNPNEKVESFLSEIFQKAIPIWKEYASLSVVSADEEAGLRILNFTESILGHLSSIHQEMIKSSYGRLDDKISEAKTEIKVKFLEARKDIAGKPLLLPEPQLDLNSSSVLYNSSMPYNISFYSNSNTKKKAR